MECIPLEGAVEPLFGAGVTCRTEDTGGSHVSHRVTCRTESRVARKTRAHGKGLEVECIPLEGLLGAASLTKTHAPGSG